MARLKPLGMHIERSRTWPTDVPACPSPCSIVFAWVRASQPKVMADKMVVLRGGAIEQVGSPLELYHHPGNQFVAGFIGSPKMNFLSANLAQIGPACVNLTLLNGTS